MIDYPFIVYLKKTYKKFFLTMTYVKTRDYTLYSLLFLAAHTYASCIVYKMHMYAPLEKNFYFKGLSLYLFF
jgi:hypothetical protein